MPRLISLSESNNVGGGLWTMNDKKRHSSRHAMMMKHKRKQKHDHVLRLSTGSPSRSMTGSTLSPSGRRISVEEDSNTAVLSLTSSGSDFDDDDHTISGNHAYAYDFMESPQGVEVFTPAFWDTPTENDKVTKTHKKTISFSAVQTFSYDDDDACTGAGSGTNDWKLSPATVMEYKDSAIEALYTKDEDDEQDSMSSNDLSHPYTLVRDWTGPAGMRLWSMAQQRTTAVGSRRGSATSASSSFSSTKNQNSINNKRNRSSFEDSTPSVIHWATLPPRWSTPTSPNTNTDGRAMVVEEIIPVSRSASNVMMGNKGFEVVKKTKRLNSNADVESKAAGFEVERMDL